MKNLDKKNEHPKGSCVPAKYSNIITEDDKIHLVKDKHPALLICFLGAGLVGNIIGSEFVEQLKMEQIGYVVTEDLPAIAIFYDGILKHPFRLYYSEEKNIIVAQCEVPFNKSSRYLDLARCITDFALKIGVEEICCIQGISIHGSPIETHVYVAAEKEIIDRIVKTSGVEILPRGLVVGPEAEVLNVCLVNKLNGYALLTPVNPDIPSPDGAAVIIERLNEIYGVDLSIKKLLDSAQKIKTKLMELNEKTQQQHKKIPAMTPTTDTHKSLYL